LGSRRIFAVGLLRAGSAATPAGLPPPARWSRSPSATSVT